MLLSAMSSRLASIADSLCAATTARKFARNRSEDAFTNTARGMIPKTIAAGYQPPATIIAALSGTKAARICRLFPLLIAKLRVHMLNA